MGRYCDICKHEKATNFYKDIINGQQIEISLCDKCAHDYKVDEKINIFFSSIFDDMFEETPSFEPVVKKTCKCGATEDDILRTGRFGCSECYKTFSNLVNTYVSRLGGKTYSGVMPDHLVNPNIVPPSIEDQIKNLKIQLSDAVKKEDYDRAEALKNKIIELEGKK